MSIRPGRDPKLGTVAAVADVTGHKLAVLDAETDEVLVTIDAPERASEQGQRPKATPKPKVQETNQET